MIFFLLLNISQFSAFVPNRLICLNLVSSWWHCFGKLEFAQVVIIKSLSTLYCFQIILDLFYSSPLSTQTLAPTLSFMVLLLLLLFFHLLFFFIIFFYCRWFLSYFFIFIVVVHKSDCHIIESIIGFLEISLHQRYFSNNVQFTLRKILMIAVESIHILCESNTRVVSSPVANNFPVLKLLSWASTSMCRALINTTVYQDSTRRVH